MALFPSYQSYRSVASPGKDRTVRSRAPSPSAIGFRVPHRLPASPALPDFVPRGGRGRSRQYIGRQPLGYTNEGVEIIDLTGHDWKRPALELQAARRGLTRAKADGHSTAVKDSDPAWTGTRTAIAGDGGYGDHSEDSEDSEDSDDDLLPLDVLMARATRKLAMAKAGDKLSTTAGRPGSGAGGQEGTPNGDRAVTALVVAPGESPDMPILLDDDSDNDDDDSNEDKGDNNEDDTDQSRAVPSHVGSLDAHSSPPGEVQSQHYGPLTSDARPGSVSTAPAQACERIERAGIGSNSPRASAYNQSFPPRPEGAWKDSTGPDVRSPTEEASDYIYQDGDNGCREPERGVVDAPFGDSRRHFRSSASQIPEHTEDTDTQNIVLPSASPTFEPAAVCPDYVPLRPDAQLRHMTEAGEHGQQEDMLLHHLHKEGEERRRRSRSFSPSPSPSSTVVEKRPSKRRRYSKPASQPTYADQNACIARTPQEQESNIPTVCDGREVKPGDYVIVACETEGSDDDGCDDLPDIARVDKIRSDGLLNITWTYHPSHPIVPRGSEHGRFELLISDHKDTVVPKVLTGFVEVTEYCENCLEAGHWCWAKQFQTRRRRIRTMQKPRRHEEAS